MPRFEFCELCRLELWDVPLEAVNVAIDNLTMARSAHRRRYGAYWKNVASNVDVWARGLLPACYVVSLVASRATHEHSAQRPGCAFRAHRAPLTGMIDRCTVCACVLQVVIFNLDFSDDYDTNAARAMNEPGYASVVLGSRGIIWMAVLLCAAITIFVSFVVMKRVSDGRRKKAESAERAAVTGGLGSNRGAAPRSGRR